MKPAGSEVWTALRIEAGLSVYGVDISEENLAQEVGLMITAISFTKGCYLGQEPIARIDALGHVNRELRSLRITGEVQCRRRGLGFFPDAAGRDARVGTISSSGFSFGSNSPVAAWLFWCLNVAAPGSQVRFMSKDRAQRSQPLSFGSLHTEERSFMLASLLRFGRLLLSAVCLALAASNAWAEHAVIKLQITSPDGKQESFADQEPPAGGIKRRPRISVTHGKPLVFEFVLTNAYPHKQIEGVVVRYFVVRTVAFGRERGA